MFNIPILGNLIDGVSTYFSKDQDLKKVIKEGKLALKKIEIESAVKVIEARALAEITKLSNQQTQDYDLDKIAMQDMKNGYLDEFLLFVFLAPIFKAYYDLGFAGLENVPTWYLSLVVGMVVVKYGMRGMLRDFMSGKYNSLKLGK